MSKKQNKDLNFDLNDESNLQDDQVSYVIKKYAKKGFESLSLEELAVTMVTNDFGTKFK